METNKTNCESCSSTLQSNAKFCDKCGVKVKKIENKKLTNEFNTENGFDLSSPKRKSGLKGYAWILLILILVIAPRIYNLVIKNKINKNLQSMEEMEGKPIRQILDEKIAESNKAKEIIIRNGLKEKVESQYGKPLESIPINVLISIVANNNLK